MIQKNTVVTGGTNGKTRDGGGACRTRGGGGGLTCTACTSHLTSAYDVVTEP